MLPGSPTRSWLPWRLQALLGFTSEARWLRFGRGHLRHMFPYLPQQPGYNKRLRRGYVADPGRARVPDSHRDAPHITAADLDAQRIRRIRAWAA